MTEIDRVIRKGIITEDFLKEEDRENYHIGTSIKKVWAIELDLFSELKRVCDKYGLKYYMDGGTLLGAIRHADFIPWDDDLDFVMPREDYNKLLAVADNEFESPYYFQTGLKDKNYFSGIAKLRNSNTTGIAENRKSDKQINQGIWIDLFPMDYVTDNPRYEKRRFIKLRLIDFLMKSASGMTDHSNPVISKTKMLLYYLLRKTDTRKLYRKFDSIAQTIPKTDKDLKITCVEHYYTTRSFGNIKSWPCSVYGEPSYVKFSNTELPSPAKPKEILAAIYGDSYMQPKQIPNMHPNVIFDTDKPYFYYLENNQKNTEND